MQMSEAIEQFRELLKRDDTPYFAVSAEDLRELLAGYILPEHHAAIREALEHQLWRHRVFADPVLRETPPESTEQQLDAALAAMPKVGA